MKLRAVIRSIRTDAATPTPVNMTGIMEERQMSRVLDSSTGKNLLLSTSSECRCSWSIWRASIPKRLLLQHV